MNVWNLLKEDVMNKKFSRNTFALIFAVLCAAAFHAAVFAKGADADAEKAMQEKVQKASMQVMKFLGAWSGSVTLTTGDGQKNTVNATSLVASLGTKGVGVYVQIKTDAFEETDLIGYDAATDKVRMLAVNSNFMANDFIGGWKDENTLELTNESVGQEGSPMKSVLTFTWKSAKELSVKNVMTLDGKPFATVDGTLTRK